MKVKTFCRELLDDYETVFSKLDTDVCGLGDVKIITLTDKFYPMFKRTDGRLVRVVVYE